MNDQQFKQFMQKFDSVMDQKFSKFKDELVGVFEPQFQDIEGKIDWVVNALDTDTAERLAISTKLIDHERRISKLELATN